MDFQIITKDLRTPVAYSLFRKEGKYFLLKLPFAPVLDTYAITIFSIYYIPISSHSLFRYFHRQKEGKITISHFKNFNIFATKLNRII